jgi:hypothetical protein
MQVVREPSRTFIIRHWRRITGQSPQRVVVATGQAKRGLDPFPAFNRSRLSFSLNLDFLRHQPIERGRVLQPATIIALKEIMQHRATRGFIGINTDKDRAPV